jgi:lipopolysaccharide export system protein LptA
MPDLRAAGCVIALALGAGPAAAAGASHGYYTIETAAARYNSGTGAFVTTVPITITRPGLEAHADRAQGNTRAGTAVLRGNVHVHDDGGAASPQGHASEPATLTCDELDVDAKADRYRAIGRAEYRSATQSASADTMLLDRRHKTLHLEGNVTMVDGDATARADAIDIDMAHGQTVAHGAPVILSQPAAPALGTEGTVPSVAPTIAPSRPGVSPTSAPFLKGQ